jgi:hypothetical protein
VRYIGYLLIYIAILVIPPLIISGVTSFLEWEWIFFWSNETSRQATVFYWGVAHIVASFIFGDS